MSTFTPVMEHGQKSKTEFSAQTHRTTRAETLITALGRLRQAGQRLHQDGDLAAFYTLLVEDLMVVTTARFGLFSTFDSQGEIGQYIVRGMSREEMNLIGHAPQGRGLLRVIYHGEGVVRVNNIGAHAEACGFPEHHPPMASLLGCPLKVHSETRGVLYLTDKVSGQPFDEWDEEILLNYAGEAVHVLEHTDLLNRLKERNTVLEDAQRNMQDAHQKVLQSEKMACIGQLAAGVAHEINNPVGYIGSNMGALQRYLKGIFEVLESYVALETVVDPTHPAVQHLATVKQRVDFPFLRQDLVEVMKECEEGISRVKRIVKDLKDFSHVDDVNWEWVDLRIGIESTLNVVRNEVKYKAEVHKEFEEIPLVQCMPGQLNQVWMNLLVNAAQAITDHGTITIRVKAAQEDKVCVEVEDTGGGIKPENIAKIFDPFFTTKPVGQGTGLGLSVSFGIVQTHHGEITVESQIGKGTLFRVLLPVSQGADRDSVEEREKV